MRRNSTIIFKESPPVKVSFTSSRHGVERRVVRAHFRRCSRFFVLKVLSFLRKNEGKIEAKMTILYARTRSRCYSSYFIKTEALASSPRFASRLVLLESLYLCIRLCAFARRLRRVRSISRRIQGISVARWSRLDAWLGLTSSTPRRLKRRIFWRRR